MDTLTQAIIAKNLATVQAKLEKRKNINRTNVDGLTPLMVASRYSNLEMVKLMIAAGADVNAAGKKYYKEETPLTITANSPFDDRHEILAALVAAGANIDHKNEQGDTVLMLAVVYTNKMLYEIRPVLTLVELGANTNIKNKKGETPVKIAQKCYKEVKKGYEEKEQTLSYEVFELLRNRASTLEKITFVKASQQGDLKKVQESIVAGIDVNYKSSFGTALLGAIQKGHSDIVELLIKNGANLSADKKIVPLLEAIYHKNLEVVKLLVKANVDVNQREGDEDEGVTPLIEAAAAGEPKIVEFLLAHGADIHATFFNERSYTTKSAVNMAMEGIAKTGETKFRKVLDILKKAGGKAFKN